MLTKAIDGKQGKLMVIIWEHGYHGNHQEPFLPLDLFYMWTNLSQNLGIYL